jgi:hypothetical protein
MCLHALLSSFCSCVSIAYISQKNVLGACALFLKGAHTCVRIRCLFLRVHARVLVRMRCVHEPTKSSSACSLLCEGTRECVRMHLFATSCFCVRVNGRGHARCAFLFEGTRVCVIGLRLACCAPRFEGTRCAHCGLKARVVRDLFVGTRGVCCYWLTARVLRAVEGDRVVRALVRRRAWCALLLRRTPGARPLFEATSSARCCEESRVVRTLFAGTPVARCCLNASVVCVVG